MKRLLSVVLLLLVLCACTQQDGAGQAMAIRDRLLSAEGCSFVADISADYGDKIYSFTMNCTFDSMGNMNFNVQQPASISGVTGQIRDSDGFLTFDDKLLAFELLADDQITPVSAPWIVMKTIRSGYINACAQQEGIVHVTFDDSYEEDALQVDVWFQDQKMTAAELLWRGRRIMTISVKTFTYL